MMNPDVAKAIQEKLVKRFSKKDPKQEGAIKGLARMMRKG